MSKFEIKILADLDPVSPLGQQWETLTSSNIYSGIMQSLYWAQAKREQGVATLHLGIFKDNDLCAGGIFYKTAHQKSTNILIAPEGPVLPWHNKDQAKELLAMLIDFIPSISWVSPIIATRIEPRLQKPLPAFLLEFSRAPVDLIPRETLYIDLSLSADSLLAQMKEKGRYNIRLSQRNNIEIIEETSLEAVDQFYSLLQEASIRDDFALEPKHFFQCLANNLIPNGQAKFLFCKHENDLLGTLLLITYGKRATYLYGGISNKKRNLMGGYALQWHAMKTAKAQGCETYDFYGYDPYRTLDHRYARFSQFKSQFGGKPINLIGAHQYFYLDNLADTFVRAIEQIDNKVLPVRQKVLIQ